jgi:tripartite-type tricarboxylate transporter receptor subunit TctC
MHSLTKRALSHLIKSTTFIGAGLVLAGNVVAAEAYPNRPIKLVVPYTPGGSIDTVGRLVAGQLQKQLGQSIIIENRPGASGTIGSKSVAVAPADGYTLLFNASSQVYMPIVVSHPTYNTEKDFTPVAQIGHVPLLVVTAQATPANNLREFIQLARANPGKMTWATSGFGTTSHLTEEIIRHEMKLKMEIVNYKGAGPQLVDVIGGFVSGAVSPMPGVYPHVKTGKLKPLAVTSKARLPQLPDVPTVSESGMPGFEMLSWYGVWGPANLPPEVVKLLADETAKALRTPELQKKFKDLSFETVDSTPEKFSKEISEEIVKIGKVAKQANIRVDF